ncbi:MAG: hypothetical protein J6W06_00635 [Bacteroidales bacterium]|nr:hypothetical protein [Bacteroidales bacterium]
MNSSLLELFSKNGELVPKDVTPWQSFSGKGMTFGLESYDWNGCACVSHLTMRAFLGMMKMDTLICTPYAKDMPLLSYDLISALWKRTLLVETYNTLVEPIDLSAMIEVKENYSNLKDKQMKPAWYDALKLPPTLSKVGDESRLSALATEMISSYLDIFASARDVDRTTKTAKNRTYVDGLINDGPTFKVVSKMIGADSAKILFHRFLFGTE